MGALRALALGPHSERVILFHLQHRGQRPVRFHSWGNLSLEGLKNVGKSEGLRNGDMVPRSQFCQTPEFCLFQGSGDSLLFTLVGPALQKFG